MGVVSIFLSGSQLTDLDQRFGRETWQKAFENHLTDPKLLRIMGKEKDDLLLIWQEMISLDPLVLVDLRQLKLSFYNVQVIEKVLRQWTEEILPEAHWYFIQADDIWYRHRKETENQEWLG